MSRRIGPPSLAAIFLGSTCLLLATCTSDRSAPPSLELAAAPTAAAPRHDVMESAFCADCHPAIYAEHEQSTHGRAFSDEEVRLATARFSHQDCIICHTPRPIFETGVGMNPIRRHFGLEEGNTCMTCHWKPDRDYTGFSGGAECVGAFAEGAGTVEACASCHRNHGTPYQWEKNPNGKESGRDCIDCHMQPVEREVAVGGPVRRVRTHLFPASRSESQVARAYVYDARIEGNVVVVEIENKGAGHNFPTELKQRSVESLVVVRDLEGREVARSRMVFRDPYKRPYGLELPVNTQIPGGETREHRVPIGTSSGTVECELFFKLYFPIEDHHPSLSRTLETRRIPFDGLTPSTEAVVGEPEVAVSTPEGITPEQAGPANLVDYARPPIGTVAVEIPTGETEDDVRRLVELFQFPVPEANAKARHRLVELGAKAVAALIESLGSWDNKTWNQGMNVLQAIGEPARPAVVRALDDPRLYVRLHARELLARTGWTGPDVASALERGLAMSTALDRASAASAVGSLKIADQAPTLRRLLGDADPDVVRAAGLALAALGEKGAVPEISRAMKAAHYPETRRDLASALAKLGSADGIPVLLAGLDYPDDLVRESYFEAYFQATGTHMGFDPLAPRPERLEILASLQADWAKSGGPGRLVAPQPLDHASAARALKLVGDLGGSDFAGSTPDKDLAMKEELVAIGEASVPALLQALKWAPGFADKRAAACECLGRIGDERAAPTLIATLRDPVISVAAWAAWALERVRDPSAVPALRRYEQRIRSLAATGRIHESAGPVDGLLVQASRARFLLGDESARDSLVGLLLSEDESTRRLAIESLLERDGEDYGYEFDADLASRRAAVARWAAGK
ncbi:MAG: HEAT repeat domain-containing protein [Planctomycetota bacterium]